MKTTFIKKIDIMKKIVYVTGCLGFIGYHVTKACLDKGWYVRGIDSGTYASNWNLLANLEESPNFTFEKIDINDMNMLYECDYIINTAAETHVDNSIVSSNIFLKSNIDGVHNILELIKSKSRHKMPVFLHFSTDEVYGDIIEGSHTEKDLLKPSNPYSATKAAADMLITAWARTYSIPYVIVRPTNNYGVGQYTEKFIPHTIKCLNLGKPAPLHDMGTPYRTWLHAGDTASAIITIIESGVINETFNISGNYEEQNIVVAKKIIYQMGLVGNIDRYLDLSVKRPGQDVRYAIDDQKLKSLGWSPRADFDTELTKIVDYYIKNFVW
jgi:dTDP-glucose 4,6-dehydratase